uniref:NADH-ubiquinone oxidoreductase chain 2 n=1 Tax=Manis crassicaudata TaxID=1496684 RepID=A0A343RBV4_9EUTH|nr:NADH dehydrogenase subunit 2 [Manis crassicaudata]ATX69014.1 NADH dehydrogenase subunit 2 [Manis crassicaudata]ATX69027.1 NADH dehydrogenase subunit 2 [Manis crassicaudata]WPW47513.1 NADH dehydrogenase subunit 2 [Manis crassicaudata]WPW47539.1 NADH dehydrogenase subunit 2 [Manis crassicaudata]WPW49457.1 NADH dehydrogenase subunit 2 [Manis crassicaudata]
MNLITLAILTTLFLGTMLVLISSHWLMIWIGFEMNMLAMVPILMKNFNPRSMEAATKYFLVQATASMLLMLAVTLDLMTSGQWTITKMHNTMPSAIITMAMAMKLGMAPFHFWVPEVTQGSPLSSGMLLLTWQKIAPMSILYQIMPTINTNMLATMAALSILVGGWGGLNQTQLRKIMAYSSIAHMGWMAMIMTYNPDIAILNLLIYIMMTLSMFTILLYNSSTTTLSLSHLSNKTPLITVLALLILLSLGGLPPLTGFMPKWMIIQELTKNNMVMLPTVMAVTALLNLYFYVRLAYSTALTMLPTTNNMKMKWQFETTKIMKLTPPLIILSTMALPLTPIMSILN